MQVEEISFQYYKAFKERQELKIRPVTILIGKNSSGKSAVAKLFTLLANSFGGKIEEPLLVKNQGVELGAEFLDLVYKRIPTHQMNFTIKTDNNVEISSTIIQQPQNYDLDIAKWSYKDKDRVIQLTYDNKKKQYYDTSSKYYNCDFRGFIPTRIEDKGGKEIQDQFQLNTYWDIDYIGPFRVLPKRQYYLSGQIIYNMMGIQGEYAYSMLGASKAMKQDLHERVGDWYERFFDGWRLSVDGDHRPYFEIKLEREDVSTNLVDVGEGMNQALPLIVRANMNKPHSLVVIEQPELHLHPAAHVNLATLFAESAKKYNQRFIIETHSENFILRMRNIIVNQQFDYTPDDVIIYWVDDTEEGKMLMEITIDENGRLSDWPEGIFNENIQEILAIKRAVKNRK